MSVTKTGAEIETEFDAASNSYYIIWQSLLAVGYGKTKQEALDDLQKAAHFGIEGTVTEIIEEIRE